jgi:hypothetical protein
VIRSRGSPSRRLGTAGSAPWLPWPAGNAPYLPVRPPDTPALAKVLEGPRPFDHEP